MLCHVGLHTENIAHIIIIENLCPVDWKKQYLQLYYEQVSQFPHRWDGLYW